MHDLLAGLEHLRGGLAGGKGLHGETHHGADAGVETYQPLEVGGAWEGYYSASSPPRQLSARDCAHGLRQDVRSAEKLGGGALHPAVLDVGKPVPPRPAPAPLAAPSTRALPRRSVARGLVATPLTETQHVAPARTAGARRLPQVKTPGRDAHFTQRGADAVPRNYALPSEDWSAADLRELEGLYERGGVEDIDISEVPAGRGHRHLRGTCGNIKLGVQPGKYKSKNRCVIDGSRQSPKPPRSETYSSTPHSNAVRALHAPGCHNGHTFRQGDLSQASCSPPPSFPTRCSTPTLPRGTATTATSSGGCSSRYTVWGCRRLGGWRLSAPSCWSTGGKAGRRHRAGRGACRRGRRRSTSRSGSSRSSSSQPDKAIRKKYSKDLGLYPEQVFFFQNPQGDFEVSP